jgi:hypothetical protein
MPKELAMEKDRINDYILEFIFNKYKHETITGFTNKLTNGYKDTRLG